MRRPCRQWLIICRWHKTSLIQGTGLGTQKGESQLLISDILHTDPHQPSISLLKSICYPETHRFSTKATIWGCEHEKDALEAYSIKHNSWHVTAALMSLHVAFYLHRAPFSRRFTRCIDWVQLLWSGSRGGEVLAGAQESSFEEAANTVARFCLDSLFTDKFHWSVITPTTSKSSYRCLQVHKCCYYDFDVWTTDELHIERIT